MTDPRTEARRRFAETLLKASHADSCMEPLYVRESEVLADAVLELFEHVEIRELPGWVYGDRVAAARQLILTGPVEPVVPEEPSRKPIRCPGCDVEEGARHDDGCHGGEWGQYAWQITEESQP